MRITPFILLLLYCHTSFAQQGIYQCNNYEFINDSNPLENRVETSVQILNINFISETDAHIILTLNQNTENPEELMLKWNIKSNMGAVFDPTKNSTKTTYTAFKEVLGKEENELYYVYQTEDHNMKTFDVIIHNPKRKTKHCFYNLIHP